MLARGCPTALEHRRDAMACWNKLQPHNTLRDRADASLDERRQPIFEKGVKEPPAGHFDGFYSSAEVENSRAPRVVERQHLPCHDWSNRIQEGKNGHDCGLKDHVDVIFGWNWFEGSRQVINNKRTKLLNMQATTWFLTCLGALDYSILQLRQVTKHRLDSLEWTISALLLYQRCAARGDECASCSSTSSSFSRVAAEGEVTEESGLVQCATDFYCRSTASSRHGLRNHNAASPTFLDFRLDIFLVVVAVGALRRFPFRAVCVPWIENAAGIVIVASKFDKVSQAECLAQHRSSGIRMCHDETVE